MADTMKPAPSALITQLELQPLVGASMMPQTTNAKPRMERTAPMGSARRVRGFLEFGTSHRAASKPRRAIGTLMRKTEPHQKWAKSNPPRTGPIATPSPDVPDQMPTARTRSRSPGKTFVRMDKVPGMRAAAPTPMTARVRATCLDSQRRRRTRSRRQRRRDRPGTSTYGPTVAERPERQ